MAIARKPKTSDSPPLPDVDVEALIAKGGSVAQDSTHTNETATQGADNGTSKAVTSFTLRVPNNILSTMDTHRSRGPYKVSRQQWIIEAIFQRLERETSPEK